MASNHEMVCKNILQSQGKLWKCQQSLATMHLKRRALSLRSHTRSLSLHFRSPKTIRAHSSNWELQLRRLCHLRRLPEQRSKSWSNLLRRPPQMHQLHMTLQLLDHFFTFSFFFTYYISIHSSMFWCFIFWDWRYPLIISYILLSHIHI